MKKLTLQKKEVGSLAMRFRELVSRAQKGDTEAFSILYTECADKIYKYIYIRLGALTGKKQLAEDMTQEVFLRTFESMHKIHTDSGSPLAYMYTTAKNLIIDHSRKKKEDVLPSDNMSLDDMIEYHEDPKDEAAIREMSGHALEAVGQLPEAVQEVIIFIYVHGYSVEEICQITDKNPEAIRKLKSRGLALLRYILRARYEGN